MPSQGDVWNFFTSDHPASTTTKLVATAALAGSITYYATRPSQKPHTGTSAAPPLPPKDQAAETGAAAPPRSPQPAKTKLRTSNRDAYVSASESGSEDEGKRVRFEGAQRPFAKPLPLAVFWDVDNCSPPTGSSGRHLVQSIRKHLSAIDTGTGPEKEELGQSGPILSFKAYLELSSPEGVGAAQVNLRSELQGSGVSLIDTPKSGRKDVADKMIIADIMAFALDVPPPARIVLISGDRDFAYPLSLIRGRGYQVILITPPIGAVPILEASANHVARWRQDVLGLERDGFGRLYNSSSSTPSKSYQRSSSPGPGKDSSARSGPPGSQSMHTSASQQSSGGNNTSSAAPTAAPAPYQPPTPAPATNMTGPGAAPVPGVFQPLVQALEEFRKEGQPRPLRSKVAVRLTAIDKDVYEKAGASSWRDYVAVAVAAGIVVVGSSHGTTGFEWIALRTVDSQLFQSKPVSSAPNGVGVGPATPNKFANAPSTPLKPGTAKTDNADEDDDGDTVSATDGIFTPPPAFEPLFDAIVEAEKVTGRNPPYTDVVGELLHKSVVAGKCLDPFSALGVKSFGSYITAAFKQRVARLTPSETKGRAALAVMPAYQAYLDSLRRGGGGGGGRTPLVPGSSRGGSSSPTKKPGVLPGLMRNNSSSKAPSPDSPFSSSSTKGTPSGAKKPSAYDAKPGLLLPHLPSGTKIAPIYFPLANVLLFEREKGNQYSTDSFLYPIVTKHKYVGGQLKSSEAFAKYLDDAERDEVVTIEPGFKPGVRHVRLSKRLHDPRDASNSPSDRLPPAGADPYTTSPPRPTATSTATATSSPSEMAATSAATAQPGVEDRKRFKPLMDVMFALRKDDPPVTAPRRAKVLSLLAAKHCPDADPDDTEAIAGWLAQQGASSIGDYTRQAEKFGFVVLGREDRSDGGQGKKTVKLAEKYEAKM